jgi:hypothetical protein
MNSYDRYGETLTADYGPGPGPDDPDDWTKDPKRRFPLVPFSKIQVSRSPAYLVRNIIPREGLIVVWGPPGCGKSFWVLDLVLHVALERKYREHRVKQGDVCYVACEGERGLNNRVAAWRQHNNVQAAPFWLVTTHLDLVAEHKLLVSDIREQIGKETKPSVIVLDTLNRSLNGSESSDEDMAAYIRAADTVRSEFCCAVIVIHHCGLDATRPRGHTSLKGASDAQIAIINTGQTVIATVERMKDGAAGTIVASTLRVIDLDEDEDSEPITSCAIEPATEPKSTSRPVHLTDNEKIGLRTLERALKDHGIMATVFDNHTEGLVVRIDDWRDRFYREGKPAEQRKTQEKAFKRAVDGLLAKESIATRDNLVWPLQRR